MGRDPCMLGSAYAPAPHSPPPPPIAARSPSRFGAASRNDAPLDRVAEARTESAGAGHADGADSAGDRRDQAAAEEARAGAAVGSVELPPTQQQGADMATAVAFVYMFGM